MEVYFLCLFLLICSVFDIIGRRVPNWLFISGLTIEALYKLFYGDYFEVIIFLTGFIVTQIFLGVLWICGFFGAADMKILGVVCASAGQEECLKLISCVLVSGAAVSFCFILMNKKLLFRIANIRKYICESIRAGKLLNYRQLFCEDGVGKVPFVPIITIGYLLYLLV